MHTQKLLAAAALLTAANISSAQVLDFESFPTGGTPAEGGICASQFKTSHGISFVLENGSFPVFAVVGAPQTAFQGPGPGATEDMPAPGVSTTGSVFLTDDGLVEELSSALIINYTTPASVVSGDMLDIDGDDSWLFEARDDLDNVIATTTLSVGDPGTGDGLATRWSFELPTASIHSVRISYTGGPGNVGFALDRLSKSLPAVSYCTAGTSASGCTATLFAAGTPSATASSGFTVSASGVEGSKDGLFFFGINGRQANPWGASTSFQCVLPPVRRAGLLVGSGANGTCDGSFTQDMNARWCPTCPKPNHNPGPGAIVNLQLWYRDPLNPSGQTTSLSNALEFELVP